MNKNKKKKIIIISVILLLLIILGVLYIIFNFRDKNSLTLKENRWIDSNKYNVIDIAVVSDIPILSYDGEGVAYDYINYLSNKRSLKFNIITYKLDNKINYDYVVDLVSVPSDNELILLKDNLVLITREKNEYTSLDSISNLKLGIYFEDKQLLDGYLDSDLELVEYDTYTDLKNEITKSLTDKELDIETENIDGIIIPKTIFTKDLIEKNLKISFQFNDLYKYFVLRTSGAEELNSIIKKTYNSWKSDNYETIYNSNLLNNYFKFKKVSDTEIKKLQSKNYVYGFIDYGIYNNLKSNKISGFNELLLKDFNKFSGLSLKYTKYNSISKLYNDFNLNQVDFIMNIGSIEYQVYTYETSGVFNKQLAIISSVSNKEIINSLYSLKNKEVLTIKDSYLEDYLTSKGIKVKSYNNLKDLATDFSNKDIALIDLENYNYYKTSAFKNAKIDYILNLQNNYNFVINNSSDNSTFKDIFDFYLNYINIKELIDNNYESVAYKNINIVYILIVIIIILCAYVVIDFTNHVKYLIKRINKNRKINLSKEDKIKYIDQLTSLKNRAYLNSNIEKWDASEVYPQAIIIIDLNNISYINDNYGREEGDKVITEAANILIQNQLGNSEIIRTDGNEFMVYLVGYDEKQIVSYLRKLNKDLKELSHGFGAASGYSIITDQIKTFDDAVNEATIDMKNNKEDINY